MQKYIKMKLKIVDKYFFNPDDKKYKMPTWIRQGEVYHMTQRGSGREEPIIYFADGQFISASTDKKLITYREIVDSGKEIIPVSLHGMYYHKSRRRGSSYAGYSNPIIYGIGGEISASNPYSDMWRVGIDTYDVETGGLGSLGGVDE